MAWSRALLLVLAVLTLWTACSSSCAAAAVQGDAAAAAAVSGPKQSKQPWGPALRSLPEALLGRNAAGTVVVQDAAPGVGPSILRSKETFGTVLSLPAAPSAAALVGHDAPSAGPGTTTKPALSYITPLGYSETDNGGGLADLAEAMGLPAEKDGLKLSRWVICSWVVANISAVDAVRNRNSAGVFLERIPQLLRSVQDLAPSQVYAVAAANITMGFTFTGVEADSLSPAATAAVKQTASNMAGGYSQQLITVSTTPPAASQAGSQVELQATVQEASTDAPAVVKRGKDLGGPPAAAAAAAAGRRLQQQQPHAGGAAVPSQLATFLDGGGGLQQLPEGALSLSLSLPRRFLQGAARAAAAKAAKAAGGSPLPVWLVYKHVAPANTTALLMELCSACNVTPSVAVGYDFAPQPCGQDLRAALEAAGVKVNDDSYSQLLAVPPTVSLSVRLAVGMTAAQVAAGTDATLARWLAEPSTAQAVARMYAPDAVIRWLHTPEIWYQTKAGQSSSALSPGAAAGIAVGCTAAVSAAVALAAWMVHRRKQQGAAAADDKADGTDSQSSGRRRRRQGKRRYLLPDPPQPDSQSTGGAGGAGPSGLAASAGSATANGQDDGSAHEDDAEMTPDQIRPHLRSLGDSVTSAVRFEQSDEEEEAAAAAGADAAEGAAAAAAADGPPAAAVAGAATALAAGAAALGSAAAGTSSSAAKASSQSVLEARAALVAEYRLSNPPQQDPAAAVAASGNGGQHGAGSSTDPSVPAAVSPELAAAAEICSAVGTPNHRLSPAGTLSAGGVEMTPRLLKPVDERAAAASAAAVAAAASLPQAGAVAPPTRRKTPFAAGSYNFEGLAYPAPAATATVTADAAMVPACPAAAMAAASAKAVVLPPRRLPLSPGINGSSSSPPDTGSQAAAAAAAGTGHVTSPRSVASRPSSNGCSSTQQQQHLLSNGTAAALGRRSSSGSASSLPSPLTTGSLGVGLQQLVSVSSPAGSPASDTAVSGFATAAHAALPGAVSNGSVCSSVLQAATESGDSSALQFSSSFSGPVLLTDSATTLSPTSSRWPSSLNGVQGAHKLQGAAGAGAEPAALPVE